MPITIVQAADADRAAVMALLSRSALPEAGLAEHFATTMVARDGDAVVGCAAVEPYGAAGLLRSVTVDAAWRGAGLGGRLTEAALSLARARGIRTVYLLTETAGDFFRRFGFRPVTRDDVDPGVRRSVEFTSACPASALVMALDLAS
jgi:amino-acid N-acetyltransferase